MVEDRQTDGFYSAAAMSKPRTDELHGYWHVSRTQTLLKPSFGAYVAVLSL